MPASASENPCNRPPRRRLTQLCVVAAVAMAAGMLLAGAGEPLPTASAQPVSTGGRPMEIFAVAGQITPDTYGLYLVDAKRGSVVVYEYVPAERQLHLRAARSTVYDLQLEAYNTSPDPAEVADMVRRARRISETTPSPK